ncbi:cellulose synthase family protein [Flavobacterium sp. CS20]|uniref:cellulose synthase family protein n=1 Tax=Flavobacterium sp. CS20 TaxID=2775246 RepID=UPI001B3A0B68|nr:cellulose synthase family protein [Flavobacterium sp. CS20]QTY26086.1 glycosyltransferase family 2 protein [Flavobacterium sp. CS20]
MNYFVIGLYAFCLFVIFIYSLAQLNLLINYLKAKKNISTAPKFDFRNQDEIPFVTVQLPLYNELYVVDRLLDNISKLDYPKHKLEIQVLDDSTDQSVETTAQKVKALQKQGLLIHHIKREKREGFKAGALKEGLKIAKGQYIAVFDSDFMPKKDWSLKTLPYFKDEKIGVVQTRWSHINRNYSLLTKIQAFALDFHFILEQVGRNFGQHFINFNGTAGVWRKECIIDAGNWQGDTLTEDLDLSYRAQLKNWKFKYLEEVETPAELPIIMSARRSQQFRWNKGAAENFKKFKWRLLKEKSISKHTKFHGILHLLNSSMFIIVLLTALLSVPVLYIKKNQPELYWVFHILAFFAVSTVIFFSCYWQSFTRIHGGGIKNFFKFFYMFIVFFSIAMGFSLHNTLAVLEGHFGKKSSFIRTPKFNINKVKNSWKNNIYINREPPYSVFIEFILCVYFGFAIFSAFYTQDFGLIIFHLMLFFGFGFVSLKSLA